MTDGSQGRWAERSSLMGVEFYQKTLGVVGLGAIGKKRGGNLPEGVGMRIVAYDPYLKELPPGWKSLWWILSENSYIRRM